MFSLPLFNGCNKIPFIMISALTASLHHVSQLRATAKMRHEFCLSSETTSESELVTVFHCESDPATSKTSK